MSENNEKQSNSKYESTDSVNANNAQDTSKASPETKGASESRSRAFSGTNSKVLLIAHKLHENKLIDDMESTLAHDLIYRNDPGVTKILKKFEEKDTMNEEKAEHLKDYLAGYLAMARDSHSKYSKLLMSNLKEEEVEQRQIEHIIEKAARLPHGKKKRRPRKWTKEEDTLLRNAVEKYGEKQWKTIATMVPNRNNVQCLQRWKKVLRPGLVKGQWLPAEDEILKHWVHKIALDEDGSEKSKISWTDIAMKVNGRTAKQCRERWQNYLSPKIKRGDWSEHEDRLIMELQSKLGNAWSTIAKQLHGRTENAVKIRFHSLARMHKRQQQKLAEDTDELTEALKIIAYERLHPKSKTTNNETSAKKLKPQLQKKEKDEYIESFNSRVPRKSNTMKNRVTSDAKAGRKHRRNSSSSIQFDLNKNFAPFPGGSDATYQQLQRQLQQQIELQQQMQYQLQQHQLQQQAQQNALFFSQNSLSTVALDQALNSSSSQDTSPFIHGNPVRRGSIRKATQKRLRRNSSKTQQELQRMIREAITPAESPSNLSPTSSSKKNSSVLNLIGSSIADKVKRISLKDSDDESDPQPQPGNSFGLKSDLLDVNNDQGIFGEGLSQRGSFNLGSRGLDRGLEDVLLGEDSNLGGINKTFEDPFNDQLFFRST